MGRWRRKALLLPGERETGGERERERERERDRETERHIYREMDLKECLYL